MPQFARLSLVSDGNGEVSPSYEKNSGSIEPRGFWNSRRVSRRVSFENLQSNMSVVCKGSALVSNGSE